MSATTLEAPAPRGLSRLRRNKGNQSSTSLASSSSAGNESGEGTSSGLKATITNAMEKVRKSVDDRRESVGEDSPQRRLSTMFKRKKRGDSDARPSSQMVDSDSNLALPTGSQAGDAAHASLSRRSSLLTDDGDESSAAVRPTLSAHNSHHGFLTLSSPAANSRAETEEPASDPNLPVRLDTAIIPSINETTISAAPPQHDQALSASPHLTNATHKKSISAIPALQTVQRASSKEELEGTQPDVHPVSFVDAVPGDPTRPETPLTRLRLTTDSDTSPNRAQTPDTLVTPPTPVVDSSASFGSVSPAKSVDGSARRRRALSGGHPSRLSRSLAAPLTPTVEEAKTPGGTEVQPNNATGFFSSVFSAAQKAADQLSSTISVPGVAKNPEQTATPATVNQTTNSSAGNQAALQASPDMSSTTDLTNSQTTVESDKDAAARAVSNAYEKPQAQPNGRPSSIASTEKLNVNGDHDASRHPADGEDLKRTGSIRSRLSARRHRGSSAATGNGVGAALRESAAGLQQVATGGQGHRMTGFAVASKKRNKDFHQQFRSVPEDDYLIEDYSAALQRDILLHGRLYVSEGHICFSSNILGWITNLVMSFDEIVAVEKKSTAVIFPNAIVIQTVSARNTFASFVARDSTYELIIGIWKINHPHLKSSLNGVALENAGTGDKTEKAESTGSDESDTESDEFYDEDAEDDGKASYVEGDTTRSVAGSDVGDAAPPSKPAAAPTKSEGKPSGSDTKAREITRDAAAESGTTNANSSGPDTHGPTECGDEDKHYDRALIDATIPAPLGKIYSLMWGPSSGAFMSKWLVDDQKSRELDLKDDKTGLDNDHKTFSFSYIKPLGGSVGPKQTKCITTNTLEQFDLEKVVSVSCSTQTPDVPSGSVFSTKTRYCLTWAANNQTRLVANCTIEWTGKSWLKGPIEKGAQDGQTQYAKDIVAALKAATTSKSAAKAGGAKKGKKKGKRDDEDEAAAEEQKSAAPVSSKTNWGPLEPIHGIVEPVLDLVRPFLSPQVTIAVLFVLIMYTWFAPASRGSVNVGFPGYKSPDRIAAYEQLWQREESDLWDWLEDRVGLDEVYAAKLDLRKQHTKNAASKKLGKQIVDQKMSDRQLDEAIQITQERLEALKDAVEKKKEKNVKDTPMQRATKAEL